MISNLICTPTGEKDISLLEVGDEIIGNYGQINIVNAIRSFDDVWFTEQGIDDWKWWLINGVYKFFNNQNIILAEGDYTVCHVSELKVGWKIYDKDNNLITITSIEETSPDDTWIKLDISGDHSYILQDVIVHNASRFFVGGGSSNQWNAATNTNWSATSGGSNNASVPVSTDDATFDGSGSGNVDNTVTNSVTFLSLTITTGFTHDINFSSNFTIAGNFTDVTGHTWSGTGVMSISTASTIISGSKTFNNNINFSGAFIRTISTNDFTVSGTFGLGGTVNSASNVLIIQGSMTVNSTTSGTAPIKLDTGGIWQGGAVMQSAFFFIGNCTISGTVAYNTGTITWTSGVITTTGSTLNIGSATTFNTDGMTWGTIVVPGTITVTLNSTFRAVQGTFGNSSIPTWAGTAGFSFGTYLNQGDIARTHTFANGVTYSITTALTATTSKLSTLTLFTSNHATNKAIITLQQGATCNVMASFTRIDASAGRTIVVFNGVITTCLNILEKHDYGTISHVF